MGNLVTGALLGASGAGVDLALLNTSGLRAELPQGPVRGEDLFALLPFEDELVTLLLPQEQLSELLDSAARRAARQGCSSPLQLSGLRVELRCEAPAAGLVADSQALPPWVRVATSAYVAQGLGWLEPLRGSLEQRGSSLLLREALEAKLVAARPCGAEGGSLPSCRRDEDCGGQGKSRVCACPGLRFESSPSLSQSCQPLPGSSCEQGVCVLRSCRDELASMEEGFTESSTPSERCSRAGLRCASLPCVDEALGALSDGRIRLEGP